nr:replication helicase subunit [Morbakka sp. MKL-2023]
MRDLFWQGAEPGGFVSFVEMADTGYNWSWFIRVRKGSYFPLKKILSLINKKLSYIKEAEGCVPIGKKLFFIRAESPPSHKTPPGYPYNRKPAYFKSTQHVLSSETSLNLRRSYWGDLVSIGANRAKKVYAYDINSLYPFSSLNKLPLKFEGWDYSKDCSDCFGFVEIQVPEGWSPLGKSTKLQEGNRTMVFSEELKSMLEEYPFIKPLRAMRFSSVINSDINFILSSFYLRKENHTNYNRLKLILNYWYGRLSYDAGSIIDLSKTGLIWAIAITAYSRILLRTVKKRLNCKILYSDIDSLFINKMMPPHLLGEGIGLWKNILKDKNWSPTEDHKYWIDEAIWASPKCYKIRTNLVNREKRGIINKSWSDLGLLVKRGNSSGTLVRKEKDTRMHWVSSIPINPSLNWNKSG